MTEEIGLLLAFVIGLAEIAKLLGLNKKYVPVLNLVLGIVLSTFFMPGDVKESILAGIAIGLSASGLFDQTKILKSKGGNE